MTIKTNIPTVHREIIQLEGNIDKGARAAVDEIAEALEKLIKEEIKGQRGFTLGPQGGKIWDKAEAGKPPMNRTGNLRKSIKSYKIRQGFATYRAEIGPTAIYSRAVEMGGNYAPPSWQNTSAMKGFPYVLPVWKKFKESGMIEAIFSKNVVRL